jgi:hypothetical protein
MLCFFLYQTRKVTRKQKIMRRMTIVIAPSTNIWISEPESSISVDVISPGSTKAMIRVSITKMTVARRRTKLADSETSLRS